MSSRKPFVAAFFAFLGAMLLSLPVMFLSTFASMLTGQVTQPIEPALLGFMVVITLAVFLLALSLVFAAASAWSVNREAYFEMLMKRTWVFVWWLMVAMAAVIGVARWPNLFLLGVAALLVGILWWEQPEDLDIRFWHWWRDWSDPTPAPSESK